MKIIFNRFIPLRGYDAVNLFGVCFVRRGCTPDSLMLNHEAIHTAQMKEMAYILFYVWYFIAWLVRLLTPPMKTAYIDISFEQEAYNHQWDLTYLDTRKPYA